VRLSASVLFLLVACGGSETPTTTAPATPLAEEKPAPAPEEHGEHGKLSPELDAFHEILAPRWHADPGPQRTKDTCAAIADFKTRAAAVKSAAMPAGAEAAAWSEAGARLETSVVALEVECTAGGADQAKFDAAFSAVHDAFHHAMELGRGGHGMKEGHGEHHGKGDGHGAEGHKH
jgi:hypothetical protein